MVRDDRQLILEFKRGICAGFCGEHDGYRECPRCVLQKLDKKGMKEIRIKDLLRLGDVQ